MVRSPNISSPTSAPGSSSAKRKKAEEEDSLRLVSKKQRTRVSFSCGECHRRKQKCNREIPCSHCIARKVPELCKAYTPGKTEQDFNARISRLERIVEVALPQYCFPTTPDSTAPMGDRPRSTSACPDDDDTSQTQEQDPTRGTFESGKWYGGSASGSVAPGSVLAQLENLVTSSSSSERQLHNISQVRSGKPAKVESGAGFNSSTLPSDGMDASSIMESVQQDAEPSPADNLNSLVQECGLPPHKVTELLQELPPQRFSDVLIDFYFNTINWTRYPVSERDFRAAYGSICANGIGTNPNHVRFLPLLFVVLAIAVRLAPENIAGDARARRITSLRYYWSSRRSLLIAAAVQPDSLDVVLTRLLSARFLTFDRRITECWSQLGAAVRTAQALGLHRDGSTTGMDPAQTEYRRRIWSYLYHADRSYALVLGRPNAIQDDYTSTLPPLNIDDESSAAQAQTPSLSIPTSMAYVILRHALAAIIGRMVHHYQQVRTTRHYSEVLTLDDELMSFVNNLPPYFALQPDTSYDKSVNYIPVHRFLLITEIWFVRISLHRPYLLRRLGSDRYRRSRRACFESAIKDFEIREAFRAAMPREARDSLSNAYREFQTAMISGIYLVLSPRGKDAAAMHAILDGFIKDHENVRDVDETTKRELKIIGFLKARASQMESGGGDRNLVPDGKPAPSKEASQPPDAQLLLDLQQSSRSSFSSPLSKTSTTATSSPTVSSSVPFSADHTPVAHFSALSHSQHQTRGEFYALSPTASGSPSGDDESAAQSLLDHLCSTVSNGPTLEGYLGTPGLSWGGPGTAEFPGWVSNSPSIPGCDPPLLVGLDGTDWSYWEMLVNHIQKAP